MPRTYVALDLELTGLDRQHDEIIEIALVRFRGDEIQDTYHTLVKTSRTITPRIEQLVGISGPDVANAPRMQSLRGDILRFIGSLPLVAHSIETDLHFLRKQGLPLQNAAVDTFELASILVPEANTYSLSSLAETLGISFPNAHRALPDAIVTKDLFLELMGRFRQWDTPMLQELAELGQRAEWPLTHLLLDLIDEQSEGALSLDGSPRSRQTDVARGIPKQETWPMLRPNEDVSPVDADALVETISPGGIFARAFPGYEFRTQQVDMLAAVSEALNTPTHLLVEAGTGTGKSLAYLLPAVQFAVQNDLRVIVSSNTINLQDQLFNKDIPDIQRIFSIPFRATLLKGRSNYICMRRLAAFRRSRQLDTDGVRVLAKVLAWLPKTQTGDQAELLLINDETRVWRELQATSETCMGDRCPYLRSGKCFFYNARSRAERAHLVIVNHALLLSDLMLENRVLPEYKHLIIDEAHHLEEQATNQFGLAVGRDDIAAFLGQLGQPTLAAPSGLLGQIPGLFRSSGTSQPMRQRVADQIEEINEQIGAGLTHVDTMFKVLVAFWEEHEDPSTRGGGGYDRHVRITTGLRIQPGWSDVEIAWDNLATPLRQIAQGLEKLGSWIESLSGADDQERVDLLQQVRASTQQANALYHGLQHILIEPADDYIYWLSVSQYNQGVVLYSAPLHVGSLLQERLFYEKECVILTSATLRTDQGFSYIKNRLGLDHPLEVALDSPFDFESAVLLYVPKDIPEPNEAYYQRNVERAILELVRATEGRTLALFTSNSQLNTTYRAIRGELEKEGIIAFGQGIDGSRRQILESFRTTPKAVLMGTRSFWEGVDIVGESLSCLIIARLPFAVPTDPILAARSETFDDPFNQYYLPETILRFRQGFGRLIRSSEDYGVVAVLDKRLLTKNYGKAILRSLPPCTARMGPVTTLPLLAERWLAPERLAKIRSQERS